MRKKTSIILAIILPFQIILIRIFSHYPLCVEKWYSTGIYPYISSALRWSFGFIPISIGDLLYLFLSILIIRFVVLRIGQRFRDPRRWIPQIFAFLSILYFCFNFLWALNYYRLPLHRALKIDNEYTTEELLALTERLIKRSNEIHYQITGNDSVKVDFPYSKKQFFELAIDGVKNLESDFPELDYENGSLKRSLFSLPLTYMGFNGYLNPFTNEAQVNTLLLPYRLPTTSSHEIGHQLGFAAENEANFVACLATMNHEDIYFRYSGYTFALGHCMNEVYLRDPDIANLLSEQINYGVRLNYQEVQEFWIRHQNPFEPLFMYTYNSFLKANYQESGMKSYSYVVALLVNYFEDYKNL